MQMGKYLFSAVIFLSIAVGLLFPNVTVLWKDYQNFLLALLMFFSALRVEKKDLERANHRQLLVLLLFVFVLMPLLSLPFKLTDPMTFIGVLFALASPSAAATAFFTSFLGGDIALGVAISFISSLLSIVTLPVTVYLLGGAAGSIDNSKIFTILIEVIIIPILAALVSKKLFKKLAEGINRYRNYQLIVMFLLASSIIGVGYGVIAGNEYLFLQQTAIIFLMLLFGGVLAYLFGTRYGKKQAVTFFVATSVKNAMLSFAIVLKLFGTTAVLPMVANLVAQFILMALFEIVGCRIL
jgi:BASS family bile acid:Na+ symporter